MTTCRYGMTTMQVRHDYHATSYPHTTSPGRWIPAHVKKNKVAVYTLHHSTCSPHPRPHHSTCSPNPGPITTPCSPHPRPHHPTCSQFPSTCVSPTLTPSAARKVNAMRPPTYDTSKSRGRGRGRGRGTRVGGGAGAGSGAYDWGGGARLDPGSGGSCVSKSHHA